MQRTATEKLERTESHSLRLGSPVVSGEGDVGSAGRPFTHRKDPKLWSAVVLSILGSAVAVATVGCFCALLYPVLKELQAERVRGQDGTEERMLGFWTILVLSVLVGCICYVFSWTLTHLDSHQPGMVSPTPAHFRDASGHGFHVGYDVAVLNGIMGLLAVIWSLI
uniref:ADP-ribosylation factor-like protein 6-interacting protein 6 n=1 Tax=Scatophagus argus TaxID=75038 RepID=UPI001ED85C3D|nr:ADP-ribosylation factor-like protein 6-interacting protein 6 [Scatophagus argus]